jgi:hypothetical protein
MDKWGLAANTFKTLRGAAYLLRVELLDHGRSVFEVTHALLGGRLVAHPYRQCDDLLLVGQPVSRSADFVGKATPARVSLLSAWAKAKRASESRVVTAR